jgi:DME family drug/metabolite transporter
MLFWEALGGVVILAIVLPLAGHAPAPPPTSTAWLYVLALSAGGVVLANFLFFAGVRRIEATLTAVAATIEPVVGALLAFFLLHQGLTLLGWVGLVLVVGGVAAGYLKEGRESVVEAQPER